MSLREIIAILRLVYGDPSQPAPDSATNGVNTRLQAKISSKEDRIVTLNDHLGEEKIKSKNLAEENQNLRIEANKRTTSEKAEFCKKAIRDNGNRAARGLAEKDAETEDIRKASQH